MRRAPLVGEPSGLRVRVPLAGMPIRHGIRNSGQVPLPAWANPDLPPAEWQPPQPSFEEDTGRQKELLRLLAKLKQLEQGGDEAFGTVRQIADATDPETQLADLDIEKLWPELEAIESQAAQRQATLQRVRAHLQAVAHGELGVRTRLRRDESTTKLPDAADEPAPPEPRASHASAASPASAARCSGKGAHPPPRDVKREPPAAASTSAAPPSAPSLPRYTCLRLKLKGAPNVTVRPESTDVSAADAAADGSGTSGMDSAAARAARAASRTCDPGVSAGIGEGGGSGGGAQAQKSAAARRAAQSAQAKAAQAQAKAAQEREELGEAAGYTSLRIKPNSSINPRQFWSAVDEYMRPLPKRPPPHPPVPIMWPERTTCIDRLLAALLPVPAAADSAAATSDVKPSVAAPSGAGPSGAAPGSAASATETAGSAEKAEGVEEDVPLGVLEKRLHRSLVTVGLLRKKESAPELQPNEVADEIRKMQKELRTLAKQNASQLDRIHRRAQAMSGSEQRERIQRAAIARAQQKAQLARQQQQLANQPPRAPKRRKGDHGSHHAASTDAAPAPMAVDGAAAAAAPDKAPAKASDAMDES